MGSVNVASGKADAKGATRMPAEVHSGCTLPSVTSTEMMTDAPGGSEGMVPEIVFALELPVGVMTILPIGGQVAPPEGVQYAVASAAVIGPSQLG